MPRDPSKYLIDGVRKPSVTEILALNGLVDFSMVDPDVLENARRRGSTLHEWLDLLNGGHLSADDEPPPEIAGYVQAFLRFRSDTGYVATAWEQVVKSPALGYCGTFDQLGVLDGAPILLDTKATSALGAWVRLQVAGYAMALDPMPARAALRLLPDGTYRFERYTSRQDVHDWLACCRVAHFKLAHGLARLE